MMMQYNDSSEAYRIYEPQKKKILISRDVVFDKTKLGMTHLSSTKIPNDLIFPNILDGSSNSKPSNLVPSTSSTTSINPAQILQQDMFFPLISSHDGSSDEPDSVKMVAEISNIDDFVSPTL
jgi:hypothetical protein